MTTGEEKQPVEKVGPEEPLEKVDAHAYDDKDDDKSTSSESSNFEYKGAPEEDAWLPSRLLFAWERPLFRRAHELHKQDRALEQDDLLPLPHMDYGQVVGTQFEDSWEKRADSQEEKDQQATTLEDLKGDTDQSTKRLSKALLDVMGSRFYIAGGIKLINSSLQFCFPILLNNILEFVEETQMGQVDDSATWYGKYRGYWLSALLLLAMGSKAITENAYFHRVIRCGFQAKTAVSVAVYNKSLRLTNAERQTTSLGKYKETWAIYDNDCVPAAANHSCYFYCGTITLSYCHFYPQAN